MNPGIKRNEIAHFRRTNRGGGPLASRSELHVMNNLIHLASHAHSVLGVVGSVRFALGRV